jgi:hypothetical protein
MYDADIVGTIQVADIRKNNDYAMWLKVSRKANCHLLHDVLAGYRKRRGSISDRSWLTRVKWLYYLWLADGQGVVVSSILTGCNLIFGAMKKLIYVHRQGEQE